MDVDRTRHVWTTRKDDGTGVCVGEALDANGTVTLRVGVGMEEISGIGRKAVPKDAAWSRRGTLEHAQQIAAHEWPRTIKPYDRTSDRISLDEIERISI